MRRTRSASRWRLALLGLAFLVLTPGCGGCGARDRGKNSDFDRPKAPDKPAEKK